MCVEREREKAQKHCKMLKTDASDGKFIVLFFRFSYVHEKIFKIYLGANHLFPGNLQLGFRNVKPF